MLLNPNDYTYKYFHQQRREDGFSGRIYYATPQKQGLCPVLVKSTYASDAINEFICCNIGQRAGVNTPRAWLFRSDVSAEDNRINFQHAVGIEYLEGFDDSNTDGSYETEELATQTIEGKLFHKIMGEYDLNALAMCKGKIYAYDFADSLYIKAVRAIVPKCESEIRDAHGFTWYERIVLSKETQARREIKYYLKSLVDDKRTSTYDVGYSIYANLRERITKAYDDGGFEDLFTEVGSVFSNEVEKYIRDLIGSVYNLLNDFLCIEGEYINIDGVLLMVDSKHADQYQVVDE